MCHLATIRADYGARSAQGDACPEPGAVFGPDGRRVTSARLLDHLQGRVSSASHLEPLRAVESLMESGWAATVFDGCYRCGGRFDRCW